MSGKKSKKERKALREAQREAERRAERRRNLITIGVVCVVVVLGGVLIWLSLQPEIELADEPDPLATPDDDVEIDPEGEDDEERPVACGAEVPPAAGEEKQTYSEPEPVLEEGAAYQAVIETSCGTVVIDLDSERTPEAVNSFVFLAQQGFFDGLEIFRNATGISALQTGAGDNDNTWSIGYTLPDELSTAEEEGYPPGAVAMANSGADTAGSQFFFVYDTGFDDGIAAGGLGPTYTRFGMVVEGLDVLQEIGAIPVEGEMPTERIFMETVTITTGQPAEDGAEPETEDEAATDPDAEPDEEE